MASIRRKIKQAREKWLSWRSRQSKRTIHSFDRNIAYAELSIAYISMVSASKAGRLWIGQFFLLSHYLSFYYFYAAMSREVAHLG